MIKEFWREAEKQRMKMRKSRERLERFWEKQRMNVWFWGEAENDWVTFATMLRINEQFLRRGSERMNNVREKLRKKERLMRKSSDCLNDFCKTEDDWMTNERAWKWKSDFKGKLRMNGQILRKDPRGLSVSREKSQDKRKIFAGKMRMIECSMWESRKWLNDFEEKKRINE